MARQGVAVGLVLILLIAAGSAAAAQLADPSPVIGTVTVGTTPVGLEVDAQTGRAYVIASGDNAVSVLETRRGVILGTIRVGSGLTSLTLDRRERRVVLANTDTYFGEQTAQFYMLRPLWTGQSGVSFLDGASGRIVRTVRVGLSFAGAVADDRHGRLILGLRSEMPPYLYGDGSVGVLRDGTSTVTRLSRVPGTPLELAVDDRANRVVAVSDGHGGTLSVIDATSGQLIGRSVVEPFLPGQTLAVDEQAGRAYAVTADLATNTGNVYVVDTLTGKLLRTVALDSAAAAVVADPQTGHVFVTTLGPLTTLNRTAGVPLALQPFSVPVSIGAGSVVMLDARSGVVLRTVRVGIGTGGEAIDSVHRHVLVTIVGAMDRAGAPVGAGRVGVVDARSGALLRSVPVGIAPGDIAVDETAGRALVVNTGGMVHAMDTWGWIPSQLRRHLPFVPGETASMYNVPGSVTLLDLSRL